MNIALWVIQGLITLVFLASGLMKLSVPIEKLQDRHKWVGHTSPGIVRLIGVLEIAAVAGLILPAALRIFPWLTLVAAIGVAVLMLGAIIVHTRLKELPQAIPAIIFLLLALVLVIGRLLFVPLV